MKATATLFDDFESRPDLVKGYIGPQDLKIRYLADPRVAPGTAWLTGANEAGKHATSVLAGRDFTPDGNGVGTAVAWVRAERRGIAGGKTEGDGNGRVYEISDNRASRTVLRTLWGETSWQMQRLRDNPECADQEHAARQDERAINIEQDELAHG